jgi:hypothetical protein
VCPFRNNRSIGESETLHLHGLSYHYQKATETLTGNQVKSSILYRYDHIIETETEQNRVGKLYNYKDYECHSVIHTTHTNLPTCHRSGIVFFLAMAPKSTTRRSTLGPNRNGHGPSSSSPSRCRPSQSHFFKIILPSTMHEMKLVIYITIYLDLFFWA